MRYEKRNIMIQGQFYLDHVSAMTVEELHSKSEIAAELAHRDMLLAEWVRFAFDVMPYDAAGADWLDDLRYRTNKVLTNAQVQGRAGSLGVAPAPES